MIDLEDVSAQAVHLLAVALMVYDTDREYADQLIAFADRLLSRGADGPTQGRMSNTASWVGRGSERSACTAG
jgi:hypothetical protein